MESRITYTSRYGLRRTSVVDDAEPYKLRIFTELDMDQIIEGIKRDRELLVKPGSMNKLAARAPMTVMERSIHEQWDDADWKKWLNDPDNDAFRIWRGRV